MAEETPTEKLKPTLSDISSQLKDQNKGTKEQTVILEQIATSLAGPSASQQAELDQEKKVDKEVSGGGGGKGFGGIGKMFKGIMKFVNMIKKGILFLLLPAILLFLNSPFFKKALTFITDTLIPALKGVWEWLKLLFTDPIAALQEAWDKLVAGFKNLGQWIFDNAIDPAWTWIKDIFAFASDAVVKGWTNLKTWIVDKAIAVKDWVIEKFDFVSDAVVEGWTSLKTWIADKAKAVKDWIVEKFTFAKDAVIAGWTGLKEWIAEKAKAVKDWIVEKFNFAVDAVIAGWTGLKEWIAEKALAVKNWIVSKFDFVSDAVVEGWTGLKEWIKEKALAVKNWIVDKFSFAKDAVIAGWDGLKTFIANAGIAIKKWFTDKFDFASDAVVAGWDGLKTFIANAALGIKTWFTDLFSWGTTDEEAAEGKGEEKFSLRSILKSAIDGIKTWLGDMFKFDSTSDVIASIVNVLTFIPNILIKAIEGITKWLLDIFGFDKAAQKLANAEGWTIGSLITGVFKDIIAWFGKILDIDITALFKKVAGAAGKAGSWILKTLGLGGSDEGDNQGNVMPDEKEPVPLPNTGPPGQGDARTMATSTSVAPKAFRAGGAVAVREAKIRQGLDPSRKQKMSSLASKIETLQTKIDKSYAGTLKPGRTGFNRSSAELSVAKMQDQLTKLQAAQMKVDEQQRKAAAAMLLQHTGVPGRPTTNVSINAPTNSNTTAVSNTTENVTGASDPYVGVAGAYG